MEDLEEFCYLRSTLQVRPPRFRKGQSELQGLEKQPVLGSFFPVATHGANFPPGPLS